MSQVTKNTVKMSAKELASQKLSNKTTTVVEAVAGIEAVEAVEAVAPTKSGSQLKIELRVAELTNKQLKQGLTKQELTWLANAEEKLESKTISRVYRELELKYKAKNDTIIRMVGASKFPTFKEWAEKMPIKSQYSYWDGVCCLVKFNKVATTATKVQRQNKKVAAI